MRASAKRSFDYQLDRHCSKTDNPGARPNLGFDYQLDRHCSKTNNAASINTYQFDYQLDRHCSKTALTCLALASCLITS